MFWAFLLASIGLTHIIVDAALPPLVRFRSWVAAKGEGWDWLKKLITCYQCSGFWVGMLIGGAMRPFRDTLEADWSLPWWVSIPVCGFAASYAAMAGAALLNYLDRPWGPPNEQPKA